MDGVFGLAEGACSWRRAMTRCECAELPFDEVARRVREDGVPFEELQERTGCGRLCSACLPDLRDHLARQR
jgi:bacterioferritin-associated ferredoxin